MRFHAGKIPCRYGQKHNFGRQLSNTGKTKQYVTVMLLNRYYEIEVLLVVLRLFEVELKLYEDLDNVSHLLQHKISVMSSQYAQKLVPCTEPIYGVAQLNATKWALLTWFISGQLEVQIEFY